MVKIMFGVAAILSLNKGPVASVVIGDVTSMTGVVLCGYER